MFSVMSKSEAGLPLVSDVPAEKRCSGAKSFHSVTPTFESHAECHNSTHMAWRAVCHSFTRYFRVLAGK